MIEIGIEEEENWLVKGMRKHNIKKNRDESSPNEEAPDGPVYNPKEGQYNWLENLINRGGNALINLLKSTFSDLRNRRGPAVVPAIDNVGETSPGQTQFLGVSLDDPMLEARSALMFIVLNIAVAGLVFGGAVLSYVQPIFVWGIGAYVLYRVLILKRFTVKTVFDNSRCAKCLENMKKIYGFGDGGRE